MLLRSTLERATLVILVALVVAAPATAAQNVIYGVNDGNFTSLWSAMAPRIAGLGIDQVGVWVRYHCGPADSDDWLVRRIGSDLGQLPSSQPAMVQLLGAASCSPQTDAQRQAYALVARALVLRYPNVRELQVWNEPDLAFWSGSASSYVQLLAVVHDALRGTHVKVLGPGFSPNGLQNARNANWGTLSFAAAVRDFYTAHPRRRRPLIDGFAYHPYWGFDCKTTSATARTLDSYWKGLPQPSPRRGLRFWWTETGAESVPPSGPFEDGYFGTSNYWPNNLHMTGDPAFQANRVATLVLKARANPFVAADFNFELIDEANLARWQSGLYFSDGAPKPAYYWFRDATTRARH